MLTVAEDLESCFTVILITVLIDHKGSTILVLRWNCVSGTF